MSAAVGDDIESICSKCGDVWHVVVAKVGDKIAKVLCKQCNATHRYKPPGDVKSAAPAKGPRRRAAGTAVKKAVPVEEARVAADLSKPVRVYRASEMFAPGERIAHPSFGEGVCEISPGPGKIEVFFTSGRRILAQAKAASTLERPVSPKHGSGGPGVG